ncbi:MAG: hypothetical protein AB7I68_11510 [Porticoccaceae bacterium]
MDRKLLEIQQDANKTTICWENFGEHVIIQYEGPVIAEPFYDDGVIVIEPYRSEPYHSAADNAVILNTDGSLRQRIENPLKHVGAICFKDIYYEDGIAKLIIAVRAYMDFGCFVDRQGKIIEVRETR